MTLTEKQVRGAKPREKDYKLYDGGGLLLRVRPNGSKLWQYKYRVPNGERWKEKSHSLGTYPEVSLREAREKHVEAKKFQDPAEERKKEKRIARFNSENTFKAVASAWRDANLNKWTPDHAQRTWRRLENHIFPRLGSRPVSEIGTSELLEVLRFIEKSGKTEMLHRVAQLCRSIFQFAVLTEKAKYNPASNLRGVLKVHKAEHYPTIGHNALPEFLAKLEEVNTSSLDRLALKFLILTFVRQGEMRRSRWEDFDLPRREWRVRAETTKMKTEHIVPLSPQALRVLGNIAAITRNFEYVFASQQTRKTPYIHENLICSVVHDMGYKGVLVGHGFRSMASTILNESGLFRPDVIERQLAHMPRDKVRSAYNRAEYLPERKEMMLWWADYLEKAGMKCGG